MPTLDHLELIFDVDAVLRGQGTVYGRASAGGARLRSDGYGYGS